MKENINNLILSIMLIIVFILFSLLILIVIIDEATTKVTYTNPYGTCYDKEGNVINEVTCIEETRCGIISQRSNPDRCFRGEK